MEALDFFDGRPDEALMNKFEFCCGILLVGVQTFIRRFIHSHLKHIRSLYVEL